MSRTTYADLFAVIGTTYGAGDSTTTFNLPDFKGNTPVGKADSGEFDTLGNTYGFANSEAINTSSSSVASGGDFNAITSVSYVGTVSPNYQPSLTVNFIIKT